MVFLFMSHKDNSCLRHPCYIIQAVCYIIYGRGDQYAILQAVILAVFSIVPFASTMLISAIVSFSAKNPSTFRGWYPGLVTVKVWVFFRSRYKVKVPEVSPETVFLPFSRAMTTPERGIRVSLFPASSFCSNTCPFRMAIVVSGSGPQLKNVTLLSYVLEQATRAVPRSKQGSNERNSIMIA